MHTTLIDEDWDPLPAAASTFQSGARRIDALSPRTSLIDAQWDEPEDERVTHASGPHETLARPPHTTLIDAEWDLETSRAAAVADLPLAPEALALPRPIIIADTVEELDPVITFVELDDPERLLVLLDVHAYE